MISCKEDNLSSIRLGSRIGWTASSSPSVLFTIDGLQQTGRMEHLAEPCWFLWGFLVTSFPLLCLDTSTVRIEIIENDAKMSGISSFGIGGEITTRRFSFSSYLRHRTYIEKLISSVIPSYTQYLKIYLTLFSCGNVLYYVN